jgi:ATP-dependent Clp protease, protease subunit
MLKNSTVSKRKLEVDTEDGLPKTDGALDKNGIYLFMGDVNDGSIKPIIEWILRENLRTDDQRKEYLQLIVSSNGGNCTACFSLIDIMYGSKIPVHTLGLGMIASCGLLIFMSGAKGHRVITPLTSVLAHQYSWGSYGKHHELVAIRKEEDLMQGRIIKLYKKATGLSEKAIQEKLNCSSDNWLSSEETKKFGLCDEIKDLYK